MERQYIGARYVPIFFENPNTGDSAWLTGVAYEALTIVTFAGNSYTSKKPVPASVGSPNLNPEYWVSTGNFNAQIEEVREEVEEIRDEVVDKFPVKPNDIAHKQFILIADSFGNPTTVGGNPWIYFFENLAGVTEGETAFSGFSGSSGFVRSGTNGTFLDLLTNITTSGNISDPNSITDIVVQTAGNDWNNTTSDIIAGIQSFVNYAREHFPYAQIHVALTSKFNTNEVSPAIGVKYTVLPALKNSQYLGYHYITNSEYIMQALTTTDGVHPNEQNSQKLAGYLYSGVMGGSVSVQIRESVSFTPDHNGGIAFDLTKEINNNAINIFGPTPVIGYPIAWTLFNDAANPLTGWGWFNGVKFGSVPTSFIRPLSTPNFSGFINITTSENKVISVPAMFAWSTNNTTGVVDFLVTTGRFTPDGSRPDITKVEMPKITFTGVTEWLL